LATCEHLKINPRTVRCALQGFGNVGATAAIELYRLGARIIAVVDLHGGVIREGGLDVPALADYVGATGSVKGFPNADRLERDAIFAVDCDCLIPAATGSQIHGGNADRIRARIIAEGANAPTTPDADAIVEEKGIFVIPDILCNAGGVFVSYLEYTNETQREQMTLEDVESRLRDRMQSKFLEVMAFATEKGRTMREAAMEIAVSQVARGVVSRGLWP